MTSMIYLLLLFAKSRSAPVGYVVEPLPRDEMKSLTTNPPCGGVAKGKSHLLSEPGSINPITWRIVAPAAGRCALKISYGGDFATFQTLSPTDNSTDANGWFSCGAEAGLFTKNWEFPEDSSCDKCTLQWIWEVENTFYYQCVDVEILEGSGSSCEGKCKNGGYCLGGVCKCSAEWVGAHCELSSAAEPVHVLKLFVSFIVLLAVVCVLSGLLWVRSHKSRIPETERLFYKRYLPCFAPPDDLRH